MPPRAARPPAAARGAQEARPGAAADAAAVLLRVAAGDADRSVVAALIAETGASATVQGVSLYTSVRRGADGTWAAPTRGGEATAGASPTPAKVRYAKQVVNAVLGALGQAPRSNPTSTRDAAPRAGAQPAARAAPRGAAAGASHPPVYLLDCFRVAMAVLCAAAADQQGPAEGTAAAAAAHGPDRAQIASVALAVAHRLVALALYTQATAELAAIRTLLCSAEVPRPCLLYTSPSPRDRG